VGVKVSCLEGGLSRQDEKRNVLEARSLCYAKRYSVASVHTMFSNKIHLPLLGLLSAAFGGVPLLFP